ncbi:hypothetical protein AGMMS50268_26680 [Spirochaetia bacterium]|nr:hypothetical protein AGMMS50268_26680 [Spirochaetia bacterium]
MTITFPGRPQGSSNLSNISSFRITRADLETVFSGNTSGNVQLLINSSGNAGEKKISIADVNTITAAINDGLAGVVKRYKETFKDGVSQGSVIDGDGSVSAEMGSGVVQVGNYDTMTPTDDADIYGTIWGNSAHLEKTGYNVTINITYNGISGDLDGAALFSKIKSGDQVDVRFASGSSDRISLGKLTKLRQAILAKNGDNPAKVAMNPVVPGAIVALFNADEVYGWPGTASSMTDTVFGEYAKGYDNSAAGKHLFDGITVERTDANTGWHINVPAGKKIEVTKLRLIDYGVPNPSSGGIYDASYLAGFGLKAARTDIIFNNTIYSGVRKDPANPGNGSMVSPARLDKGFEFLGLNTVADFPIFTAGSEFGPYLDNSYYDTDKNIGDSPRVMAFLNKLGADSTLENMGRLIGSGYPNKVTGTGGIPYSGNTPTGGTELNGNAAVYLLTKNVSLNELQLTNPTWYTSNLGAYGRVRNLVLTGANWKFIELAEADGVITSVDTPVGGIDSDTNHNLWYVINSAPTVPIRIVATVLEFNFSINDASLIVSELNQPGLEAWISNATAVGTKNGRWGDLRHIYTSVPANPTKSAWATAVKNGTALPTFQ